MSDYDGMWHIYGLRYNQSGVLVAPIFKISRNQSGDDADYPSITALSDGGFVVVWRAFHDGSGTGITGKRYNANGEPQCAVNCYTYPSAADLPGWGPPS